MAPSIPGYTYILPSAHREMYPSVDTGVVLGNGTLVLNLYYEADYHTLTLVPDTGAVRATGRRATRRLARRCCAARPRPRAHHYHLRNPGYTFTGWATENGGAVVHAPGATIAIGTDDITLYAVWVANTDTPYTIERYQLNADGTITKLPNLTGTGTTGESVTTVPVAPDGYQVPTTHYITGLWDGDPNYVINERLTDIISGDGKMVLVHVFVPVSGNYVVKIYKVDGWQRHPGRCRGQRACRWRRAARGLQACRMPSWIQRRRRATGAAPPPVTSTMPTLPTRLPAIATWVMA